MKKEFGYFCYNGISQIFQYFNRYTKLKLPIIFDNDWTVHKSVMCHIMVTGHAWSWSEWPLLLSWINGSVSSGWTSGFPPFSIWTPTRIDTSGPRDLSQTFNTHQSEFRVLSLARPIPHKMAPEYGGSLKRKGVRFRFLQGLVTLTKTAQGKDKINWEETVGLTLKLA